MKIRIVETIAKSGSHDLANVFPHGLRDVLPRACLPAGEAVATPPADCASRGQGAFYSLATASGSAYFPDVPSDTPSREGGECCPATISAFVEAWIAPRPKAIPREVDFSFKGVIGEPEW